MIYRILNYFAKLLSGPNTTVKEDFTLNAWSFSGNKVDGFNLDVYKIAKKVYEDYYFDDYAYAALAVDSNKTKKITIRVCLDLEYVFDCCYCIVKSERVWLYFKSRDQEIGFWVLQHNSNFVGLYFLNRDMVFSLLEAYDPVPYNSVMDELFLAEARCKESSPSMFKGLLVGNPRPYHYMADNYVFLYRGFSSVGGCAFGRIPLYYFSGRTFLNPKYYHPDNNFPFSVFSDKEEYAGKDFCFLRVARGSKPSFNNFMFRRDLLRKIERVNSSLLGSLKKAVQQFDFVLWLGAASEKRSWRQQREFVDELIGYLSDVKDYRVLVVVDQMTSSFEGACDNKRINCFLESLKSSGKSRVVFWDVNLFSMDEKVIVASLCDYAITNSMTDSLVVSRLVGVPGLGYCANSRVLFGSHIHPNFIHVPQGKVVNFGEETDYTRVSFDIDKNYVFNLVLSDIMQLPDSKMIDIYSADTRFSIVSSSDNLFSVCSDEFIDLRIGSFKREVDFSETSSLVFKGEASDSVVLRAMVVFEDERGGRNKVALSVGKVYNFGRSAKIRVVSFILNVKGFGSFKINGLCALRDDPVRVDYLGVY